MSNELSKPTFMIAALIGGLALFMTGFIIALEVRSTVASPAAATTGGGCYTNWNGNTCAEGYTAVETGVWTAVAMGSVDIGGTSLICAAKQPLDRVANYMFYAETSIVEDHSHDVDDEPCAICCAVTTTAVGGIGQLPDVAGTGDGLARNHVIMAAVSAAIAFGAGAFYARRRLS